MLPIDTISNDFDKYQNEKSVSKCPFITFIKFDYLLKSDKAVRLSTFADELMVSVGFQMALPGFDRPRPSNSLSVWPDITDSRRL